VGRADREGVKVGHVLVALIAHVVWIEVIKGDSGRSSAVAIKADAVADVDGFACGHAKLAQRHGENPPVGLGDAGSRRIDDRQYRILVTCHKT